MEREVYSWKDGARIKADAQRIGAHLEALRARLGRDLTATDLLNDAESRRSPLRTCFEWDNDAAAEQWRLRQARHILASIQVDVRVRREPARTVRAYIHIGSGESSRYASTVEALASKDTRAEIVARAHRELRCWRNRYKLLKELADVFRAVDAAQEGLDLS